MTIVHTADAAQPLGHYSQAIEHNGLVYVSGQIPVYPDGRVEEGTPAEQANVVFRNLDAILKAAGTDKSKVLKTTIFIADIAIWPEVNEVYAAYFGAHKPARSAVPVPALPKGVMVELEAIAAK